MANAPQQRSRMVSRDGKSRVVTIGRRKAFFADIFSNLITGSWSRLLGLIGAWYLGSNVFFALLYLLSGGVESANPGSFLDYFFFSVQTIATIGYGKMVPVTHLANLLVTVEVAYGLLAFAMCTSLIFTKFSRPSARVLFSNVAVVNLRDGVPALMFRMGNERGNHIVEATLRVTLVRNERTVEGEVVRKLSDMRLVRSQFGMFAMSWLAIHPIDRDSPLWGCSSEDLVRSEAEVVVSLIGTDETVSQTVHARHSYVAEEVLWNYKFVDIMTRLPDGRRAIDFTLFHDTTQVEPVPSLAELKPRAQA